MKSRLFTILSALSLLVFVAVVVMWVRSFWFWMALGYDTPPPSILLRTFIVEWDTGLIRIQYETGEREKQSAMELALLGLFSPLMTLDSAANNWWDFGSDYGWGCGWSRHRARPGKPGWAPEPRTLWGRLGFEAIHDQVPVNDTSRDRWCFTMPAWTPCALSALLPGVGLFRWVRRRRRLKSQLCPACGYDLRATPERCPECGASVAPQPMRTPLE